MPGEDQIEVSVKFVTWLSHKSRWTWHKSSLKSRWTNGFPGRRAAEYLNYDCVISIPSENCLELRKFHFVSTSRPKWLNPKGKYLVDP